MTKTVTHNNKIVFSKLKYQNPVYSTEHKQHTCNMKQWKQVLNIWTRMTLCVIKRWICFDYCLIRTETRIWVRNRRKKEITTKENILKFQLDTNLYVLTSEWICIRNQCIIRDKYHRCIKGKRLVVRALLLSIKCVLCSFCH